MSPTFAALAVWLAGMPLAFACLVAAYPRRLRRIAARGRVAPAQRARTRFEPRLGEAPLDDD